MNSAVRLVYIVVCFKRTIIIQRHQLQKKWLSYSFIDT